MKTTASVICGLPQSGKSTFLAALWHLVTSQELSTKLQFGSLRDGDATHLNGLAERWRSARRQHRTALSATRVVSMSLKDSAGNLVRVTFPDLSGEIYNRMWERREADPDTIEILRSGNGLLLFIHADEIQAPQWVVNMAALAQQLGLPLQDGQAVPWHPTFAPTQVKLIGLLELFRSMPIDIGPRRVAVILSAWDKAEPEGLDPAVFVATRLPLLHQYLRNGADAWTSRIYGVSAQGGEYEPDQESSVGLTDQQKAEITALREQDIPSKRIKLVSETGTSHDLTEPIAWLNS